MKSLYLLKGLHLFGGSEKHTVLGVLELEPQSI